MVPLVGVVVTVWPCLLIAFGVYCPQTVFIVPLLDSTQIKDLGPTLAVRDSPARLLSRPLVGFVGFAVVLVITVSLALVLVSPFFLLAGFYFYST